MDKRSRWGLMFVFTLVGLVLAGGAQAVPAPKVLLKVDRAVVFGGEAVHATARANTDCSWIFRWGEQRQAATGRSASVVFTAPVVTRRTRIPLEARCFARPGTAPSAVPADPVASAGGAAGDAVGQRLQVTVPASDEDTVVITVLPAGNGVSPPGDGGVQPGVGVLPDAGGPARGLVYAGLAVAIFGAVAVRISRRSRHESTGKSTGR